MIQRKDNSGALFVEIYICAAIIKTVWKILKILKIELPDGPEILLLSVYPKKTII